MFSHIVLGTDDIAAAKSFYDAALGALGIAPGFVGDDNVRIVYRSDSGALLITRPLSGKPACFAEGGTVGFMAPSREAVDRFYTDGLAAGGSDAGAPGERAAIPGSYAAYLRDPTGNKLVAWCPPAA